MENKGSDIINADEIITDKTLWNWQHSYHKYAQSMMECNCAPTKAIALFMDLMCHWELCRESVRSGDFMVMEVEGAMWLQFWVGNGKPHYLLETKRRIELLNEMGFHELEYKRVGNFVRMTKGCNFISQDDLCEKQNAAMTRTPTDPNFEQVCDRSRHLHFSTRAGKEFFGQPKNRKALTPSFESDVDQIYEYFKEMGIFKTPNTQRDINDKTFWEHVVPRKVEKAKPFVTHKSHVGLTHHEVVAAEMLGLRSPKVDSPKTSPSSVIDLSVVNDDLYNAGKELDDLSVQTTKTVQSVCSNATGMTNMSTTNSITEDLNDLVAVGGTEVQDAFDSPST